VSFTDSTGSGNSNSGALALDHSGTAEWLPSAGFAGGNHSVSASYSGDSSFSSSTSTTPLTFSITKIVPANNLYVGPNLAFQTSATVVLGSVVTLSVDVGITAPAAPPTGAVTFYLGNTTLGTATLGPPPYYNPSVSAATLNVNNLPLGTNFITASYGGDANYESATSNAVQVTVTKPLPVATLTASANASSMLATQDLIVTTNVAGGSGLPAPTGSIGLYAYGPGGTWSSGCTLVNGTCSFDFSGGYWSPGTVTVNVGYSGDTNYAASSMVVSVTMLNPFTMTASSPVSFAAGASVGNTSTLTVTSANGFAGPIYFACTIAYYPPGAQHLPTCSVPTSVNVTSSTAATAAMTIGSTGPMRVSRAQEIQGPRWLAAQATFLVGIFVICLPLRRRVRFHRAAFFLLIAVVVGMGLVSCGGGNNGGGGGKAIPGTTSGNYRFMVDGSYTPNIGTNQPLFSSQPQVFIVNVTIQ
jgi:hypothetical protein